MTTFVLMAMLMTIKSPQQVPTWTAEFTSRERCEIAGHALSKAFMILEFKSPDGKNRDELFGYVRYICVQK